LNQTPHDSLPGDVSTSSGFLWPICERHQGHENLSPISSDYSQQLQVCDHVLSRISLSLCPLFHPLLHILYRPLNSAVGVRHLGALRQDDVKVSLEPDNLCALILIAIASGVIAVAGIRVLSKLHRSLVSEMFVCVIILLSIEVKLCDQLLTIGLWERLDIGMKMRTSPSTETTRGFAITNIIRIKVRRRDDSLNLIATHMISEYTNTKIILT
jgi:hypothetical protein